MGGYILFKGGELFMPDFLTALILLVMTFAQGGQPVSTPPITPEDEQARGEQVSIEARNLETPEANSAESSQSNTNSVNPDVTQIPTDNTAAGIQMLSNVSKVAVDKSPVLVESTETLSVPGNNTPEITVEIAEINENAEFGQNVANLQPDNAKTDGQAFGEQTSSNAQNNSRRP